jgi:hypothetical protein
VSSGPPGGAHLMYVGRHGRPRHAGGSPWSSRLARRPPPRSDMPRGPHPAEPPVPTERNCGPYGSPQPGSLMSREPFVGLKAKCKLSRERISMNSADKQKSERGDLPSTCFFFVSRVASAVSAAYCTSRLAASFSSPACRSERGGLLL